MNCFRISYSGTKPKRPEINGFFFFFFCFFFFMVLRCELFQNILQRNKTKRPEINGFLMVLRREQF